MFLYVLTNASKILKKQASAAGIPFLGGRVNPIYLAKTLKMAKLTSLPRLVRLAQWNF